LYNEKAVQTVPEPYKSKYFTRDSDCYRVDECLRKMVQFQRHDLLKDNYNRGFDLILCRNVVIYFTEETKHRLYCRFADALRSKGVIFIGSTEQIFQARELGLKSIATFFLSKSVNYQ
jgi:chemotaxis protein methyltransferase CheR